MTLFTEIELDALNELTNIGVGRAAAALSDLVGEEIELNVPRCRVVARNDALSLLSAEMQGDVVAIKEFFNGGFQGDGLLVFPQESSLELVRRLIPGEIPLENLTELEQDALIEVGNIILNACIGTYGNMLEQSLQTELPTLFKGNGKDFLKSLDDAFAPDQRFAPLNVTFSIKPKNVKGYVVFLMDLEDGEDNFRQSIKTYIQNLSAPIAAAGNADLLSS